MKRILIFALLAVLPVTVSAQSDDKTYCAKLGALASRYIGSAGGDGRQAPDLNVLGAISDCDKGRYDKGIPYLEKRLRDSRITVPAR